MTQQQMKNAVYLDSLSTPCPGEMFAAINKVSRPNWAALDREENAPVTTRRAQLALAVGVFVANGYVAVEAQDGQQVKNIGRDIMGMAKALGVSQSILSRGNNLTDFADHSEWDPLRDELEATENEVKMTMVDQQDRNLVTITSAGAWLRSLEIASGIIATHYSTRGATILEEPALARHLASDLAALPDKLRNDPLVIQVRETLKHIALLMEREPRALSKTTLEAIQEQAGKVVIAIGTSDASPLSPSLPTPSPQPTVTPL